MTKKRYNSINGFLTKRFGERVYKVSLEAGLTCPNRDGTIGSGGCMFCNMESYRPLTADQRPKTGDLRPETRVLGPETRDLRPETKGKGFSLKSQVSSLRSEIKVSSLGSEIKSQLEEGISYIAKRHQVRKVISYFQSGSNTHAPASVLSPLFHEAIHHPAVVGLAISTRPDCIMDEHLDLLSKLNEKTFLWIELGLQSSHDETLKFINRGHGIAEFSSAAARLAQRGIRICAHVILGLPGETPEMMRETAKFLNESRVWGVKIHNLHVLRDTPLESLYNEGKISLPTLREYARWVVDFLEILNPEIVVHRINSHSPRQLTVAPEWSINKLAIFNEVERLMDERDARQGKGLSGHPGIRTSGTKTCEE